MHRTANLHDYASIVEELAGCSFQELDRQAEEAMRRIGPHATGDNDNVTHCALYDPIDVCWRFAAFADVPG
jgi:hypothetical protein